LFLTEFKLSFDSAFFYGEIMGGLVQVKSIAEVDEEEKSREKLEIEGESETLTYGAMLKAQWQSWKDIRQPQEDQWLINLRQFYSQYEPEIEQSIKAGRSKTYVGITRMKVMAAYARLVDIFFPATGKRHWEIGPTPEPTMAETAAQEAQEEIKTGIPDAPQLPETQSPEDRAAERMSFKINDQLVESDYDLLLLEALLEQVILGTGCLKAASINIERDFGWVNTDNGWLFQPKERVAIKPQIEGPSIFDVYPDPNAADMKSGIGCFQRHVLNKHEFRKLKKFAGFDADQIDLYLLEHPGGDHIDEPHELERKKLAHQVQIEETHTRYDVLEYWGYVDGNELSTLGVDISEDGLSEEYLANVWIVGSDVIKVELDQSVDDELPFFLFPYEKVSKKIFGRGVPEVCADSQEILNAASRRLLDDVALLGPQIEMNVDDMSPETVKNADEIFPFKVHLRSGGDTQTPLIRVHNLDSVSRELMEIINIFRVFIDEELNLPTAGTSGVGDTGGHDTAEGTKILQGAANIVNRTVVKNIDKYGIDPFFTKLYMFFMQWSADESIKGDMKVDAKGSSTLVKAEVMTTQLINMLNITNNPTDQQLTKRDNILRMVAENQGLDEDEVVKTPEEIAQLADDPIKKQTDDLAIQKLTLENQEVAARIDVSHAEISKIDAAIANDEELMRLKGIELQGKELEAAELLRLKEKEIDAQIVLDSANQKAQDSKKTAGEQKTTVGNTTKTVKSDGLKTNNT
jgi:hypothetical protein